MKYNFFLSILVVTAINSCENPKPSQGSSYQVIDIKSNIEHQENIKLSQFSEDISYVPLETKDYFFADANFKCDFLGSLILIYDLNRCALYSSNGRFLTRIGVKGSGPGEFQFCIQACFSENNSIFLQGSLYDLYEYSLDGTFVAEYKNIFRIDDSDDKYVYNWAIINDSLFFCHLPNKTGQVEYKYLLINKSGETKQTWKNYDIFLREGVEASYERKAYFNSFDGDLFVKQFFNDTIFFLNERNELIPKFIISLGDLKMPLEVRASRFGGKEIWSYIALYDFFQTGRYMFLNFMFGNRFPAKRLTPKATPVGQSWYNTTHMLGVVDKNTLDVKFCKPSNTDNPLFTTGIINDIDAGPKFFPKHMVNDSTMAMLVESSDLIGHVKSDDFTSTKSKYPEKKKELEKLAESIQETDNPVLVLVRLKK